MPIIYASNPASFALALQVQRRSATACGHEITHKIVLGTTNVTTQEEKKRKEKRLQGTILKQKLDSTNFSLAK